MTKRAFLVVGPESSGNRFVTRCFIAAGCYGDSGHAQMLDHSFEYAKDREAVVIRCSMPYGDKYPDLHELTARIRREGFLDIRVLVIVRNERCNVYSMVYGKETHAGNETEARLKIATAMHRISEFLIESQLPHYYMTYETILHETEFFRKLLNEWGLDGSKIPTPEDKNKQWLDYVPPHPKP